MMEDKHWKHLQSIQEKTRDAIEAKYVAGAKEHGGFLPDKGVEWMIDEAISEAIDQVVYLMTLKELLSKD